VRGGAVLNVLSALSWFVFPGSGAYAAAKAAAWNLTNAVRLELAGQDTQVTALHLGAADTDMMAGADHWTAYVKSGLAGDPQDFYSADWGPELQR